MLFAPPPAPPMTPEVTLAQPAALPAGFHHDRLTGVPGVWALKGNPKTLLDDQSFSLPPDQKQP